MADLSKIKLDNNIYNLKDNEARNRLDILSENMIAEVPLATTSLKGLMSPEDKRILNNLNPNIEKTISNLNASEFNVINAKPENALGLVMAVEPTVSE